MHVKEIILRHISILFPRELADTEWAEIAYSSDNENRSINQAIWVNTTQHFEELKKLKGHSLYIGNSLRVGTERKEGYKGRANESDCGNRLVWTFDIENEEEHRRTRDRGEAISQERVKEYINIFLSRITPIYKGKPRYKGYTGGGGQVGINLSRELKREEQKAFGGAIKLVFRKYGALIEKNPKTRKIVNPIGADPSRFDLPSLQRLIGSYNCERKVQTCFLEINEDSAPLDVDMVFDLAREIEIDRDKENIKRNFSSTSIAGGHAEFIQDLKKKIVFSQLLLDFGWNGRDRGKYWEFHCNIHPPDDHPSFIVWNEIGAAKDYHTQKGFDIVTFIIETKNKSFKDALKFLAANAGMQMPVEEKQDDAIGKVERMIEHATFSDVECILIEIEKLPFEIGKDHLKKRLKEKLKVDKRSIDKDLHNLRRKAKGGNSADGEDQGIYCVIDGCIYHTKTTPAGAIWVPLCNFNAWIDRVETFDNGVEKSTTFVIGGTKDGNLLPQVSVSAEKFSSMSWVAANWDNSGIVYAGQGTRDHLRTAIQLLSRGVERNTIYQHIGWRKIEKDWVYLNHGGALGGDGLHPEVLVDLAASQKQNQLRNYILPPPPAKDDLKKVVKASLAFVDLTHKKITMPLLSATYRAPLGEPAYVDFSVFLVGPTGAQKSELEALIQQHFGQNFNAKNLPGNWATTPNALEKMEFLLKDAIFTIDDFAPTGTTADIQRMHSMADKIIRGQGNLSGRGRMKADGTFQPTYYPRGLIISSGEDIPRGQSLRARMLILEISPRDVDLAKLTKSQEDAESGLFAQALSGYICWLAPQMDELKKILPARRRELRTEARKWGAVHDKTPDIFASLAIGWETFLLFAEDSEAISSDGAEQLWMEFWRVLIEAARAQSEHIQSEEPTRRFLDLLCAAINSGLAHVADAATNETPDREISKNWGWREKTIGTGLYERTEWQPQGDRVGWIDGNNLFLDPESSFATVQELARHQGTNLPLTQRTMWKRLAEKGLLASREPSQARHTVRWDIAGNRRRVIHLESASVLSSTTGPNGPNGPEPQNPQKNGHNPGKDFPPRRRQPGPETSQNGRDNGPETAKTPSSDRCESEFGPGKDAGNEESVQDKDPKNSEKHTSRPNGPVGPLSGVESTTDFNNISEGAIGHGEFCDCTECCPGVDPW